MRLASRLGVGARVGQISPHEKGITVTDSNTPPAGWYPDVNVPGTDRYWDGAAWTAHTRQTGQLAAKFAEQPVTRPEQVPLNQATGPVLAPAAKKKMSSKRKWLIGGVAAGTLIVLSGIISAINGGYDPQEPASAGSSGGFVRGEDTKQTPIPVDTRVDVPRVTGKTVAQARAAFAGLAIEASFPADAADDWVVTFVEGEGTKVDEGHVVVITAEKPKPVYSVTQQAALDSAESYLNNVGGFSRQSLIDQLVYEQFSVADATFAVDTLGVDWNAQAAESAASYIKNVGGFSRGSLIDQLLYEGFTQAQAEYGVSQNGY